ncbi:MAG: DNA polymerase III subunit delta [Myxococcales bacterium]|nr:DNA polymerase III subunit delta [Myxococcales bacterium]MCB9753529.1 DNA polymerase III subunit delta [Myxococcales bacterium]
MSAARRASDGDQGADGLQAALRAGRLDPVYVLYGDEPAAIRGALEQIRHTIIPPDDATATSMAAFNHERFDGVDVRSAAQVLEACAQLPMMSRLRLVELANPDDLGSKRTAADEDGPTSTREGALGALAEYIANPSPSTVLVIHGAGIDGRSKLVNAAKKSGWAHKFAALSHDRDAVDYTAAEVQRRQRSITPKAAQALVAAVGMKQTDLLQAIERVVLYVGDRPSISEDDVAAVVAKTREADVFALTDAVGRGRHNEALAILAAMFRAGERDTGTSMRLFALLARHMRLVFAASVAPRGQVPAVLGLPPFIANKYSEQAQQFSEARLRAAYAGLVRLDHDLKGGSYVAYASPYMAIQRWILEVCQALPGVAPRR